MVIQLLAGLMMILIGAELFTNSVEWLGNRLNLPEGSVGHLLAAVGTALPESMIPLIAFLSGGADAVDIGIGAILGAPFMLGTLAMFITGFAAWFLRGRKTGRKILHVDAAELKRDLGFFIVMYLLAVGASFISQEAKPYAAALLAVSYLVYAWKVAHSGNTMGDDNLRPLYFSRRAVPSYFMILLQFGLGLGAIVGGAEYFVAGISRTAELYGIHPLVLSMIIAPIATELPEKFNSVIWISRGKDRLALGNITGAMAFQSTMIPAMGLLLCDWTLTLSAWLSSACLLFSAGVLYITVWRRQCVPISALLFCGAGYLCFLVAILWSIL